MRRGWEPPGASAPQTRGSVRTLGGSGLPVPGPADREEFAVRFGMFIPQGWRLDLVGIPPQQHWGVMAGLARAVDGAEAWESPP